MYIIPYFFIARKQKWFPYKSYSTKVWKDGCCMISN